MSSELETVALALHSGTNTELLYAANVMISGITYLTIFYQAFLIPF